MLTLRRGSRFVRLSGTERPAGFFEEAVCGRFAVENHDLDIKVTVENGEACPCYAGSNRKRRNRKGEPGMVANKLRIIGLRPINNVVDITNYIVHAFGQPASLLRCRQD